MDYGEAPNIEGFFDSFFEGSDQDLEKILEQSVDPLELEQLGICKQFFPKVTGKLPRLYKSTEPHLCKIKRGFDYLPALKRLYLDKVLLSLYRDYHPSFAKVVIFTWVIGDGLGDYYAQLEAARILKEALPQIEISLVTWVHQGVRIEKAKEFCQHLTEYRADLNCGWDKIECEEFTPEIVDLLQSAALVLQIPTYFPKTPKLLEQIKSGPKYELVGEGGWLDSSHFHPLSGSRCLGLHFLEMGIFIKKIPKIDFFSATSTVADKRIVRILFGKEDPTKEEVEDYLFTRRFNFAYTRYSSGLYLYIHALLKSTRPKDKDIDICFFHLDHLLENMQELFLPLFMKYQVKKICIFYKYNITEVPVSPEGITLRFVHLDRISHEDFLTLQTLSQDLLGCRGDGSIFEAISANQIYFFDIAYHQRKFLKNLIELAEYEGKKKAAEYFKLFLSCPMLLPQESEWREEVDPIPVYSLQELGEKMGQLLQNQDIFEEIYSLNQKIREEHAFNPVLINLVKRAVCHYHHPQMAILEQVALDGFIHGERSCKEVLSEIRDELFPY